MCSLKCLSTRDAASCCQPCGTLPGSRSSGSTFSGRAPCQRSPRRRFERTHGRGSSPQRRGVWGAFQVHDESGGHIAMSGEDHRQTICPAGPEGRPAQPNCASQSQTAQDERHARCAADVFLQHDVNAHNATEAPPHAIIVGSRIIHH